MLVYYSCLFSGDQDKATKVVQIVIIQEVNSFNVNRVNVLSIFYGPESNDYKLVTSKLKSFQDPKNEEVTHLDKRIMKDVCSSNDDNCS